MPLVRTAVADGKGLPVGALEVALAAIAAAQHPAELFLALGRSKVRLKTLGTHGREHLEPGDARAQLARIEPQRRGVGPIGQQQPPLHIIHAQALAHVLDRRGQFRQPGARARLVR